MQKTGLSRQLTPGVSAGSMADVAFLLLIFFLVSTTVVSEKGLLVKLPPWSEGEPPKVNQEKVLNLKVNFANEVAVEGEQLPIEKVRDRVRQFLAEFAHGRRMGQGIISIQHDRGTSYRIYLEAYNEIKAAYRELWDQKARTEYGIGYAKLPDQGRKKIQEWLPLIISEAEPSRFQE